MNTGKRYSAEEMEQLADGLDVHHGQVSETTVALRQAAETEAKVMGLVEAMESVVTVTNDPKISDYTAVIRIEAIARKALEGIAE